LSHVQRLGKGKHLIGALALAPVLVIGLGPQMVSAQQAPQIHTHASAGKTTITVWEWWEDGYTGLKPLETALDSGFEKAYPQYVVNDVTIPYGSMEPKFKAAIAAGAGPDVVGTNPAVSGSDFRNGIIPLGSYLTPADRKEWLGLASSISPGNVQLTIPWQQYTEQFYYNKKLFAKAGLTSPPATWSEFIADCQTLKAHGILPLAGGFKDGYIWEAYAYPLIDQLLNATQTKEFANYQLSVDSAPFQEVWKDVLNLKPYFASNAYSLPFYEDEYTAFDSGSAAMTLDYVAPVDIKAAEKGIGASNVGIFPVPRLADSKYPPFIDQGPNVAWAVTKWSKNKQADWDYISYLESPKEGDLLWTLGNSIPNNTLSKTPTTDPVMLQMLKSMKNPLNHTDTYDWLGAVMAINEKYASEMITGETSTSSVLSMMEQLREELKSQVLP
jgi:ABC-type glycerol-3-phosphate transport system substrate-binding protein